MASPSHGCCAQELCASRARNAMRGNACCEGYAGQACRLPLRGAIRSLHRNEASRYLCCGSSIWKVEKRFVIILTTSHCSAIHKALELLIGICVCLCIGVYMNFSFFLIGNHTRKVLSDTNRFHCARFVCDSTGPYVRTDLHGSA